MNCIHGKSLTDDNCPECRESNVTPLGLVPKPKAEDTIQAQALAHLAALTLLAHNGQISGLMIIASHPDGTYSEALTGTSNFRQMIGQLEVIKQTWIGQYLASLQGKPGGEK